MRPLFVDDSVSPTAGRAGGDSGLYALAGVAVDDRDLPSVVKATGSAKAAAGAGLGLGEWEAHAYDVWNNTGQLGGRAGGMPAMRQKRETFSRMAGVAAGSRLDIIPVVVDRHNSGQQRSRAGHWRSDGPPCSGASSARWTSRGGSRG